MCHLRLGPVKVAGLKQGKVRVRTGEGKHFLVRPDMLSPRPKALTLIPEQILAALRERDQWLLWRYEWDATRAQFVKPPFHAKTGKPASTTDPAGWTSFADAMAVYRRGGWAGIGFVPLPEDNLTMIDLDHVRDPATGVIEEWAAAIVAEMPTYAEVSPSGCVLRVVCFGRKPDRERSRRGNVEVYDGATASGAAGGRYVTITGHRLDGVPERVLRRPKALAKVYRREVNPPKATPDQPSPPATIRPGGLSDAEILRVAQAAKNGAKFQRLWDGNIDDYESHSEADLALCSILAFYAGPDPVRIDRLFRQSRLVRAKWEDWPKYRHDTIAKALSGVAEFYGAGEEADHRVSPRGITERPPTAL
jgi:primase-polymerase (primpol)-like protein